MIIKINALDTLFFRDGKPFSMGAETWADGIFPPYPSVIFGALRSKYFSENIKELEMINTQDPTKNLRIRNIYYGIGSDFYFPLPFDCVKEKDDKSEKVIVLVPKDLPKNCYGNYKTPVHLLPENNNVKVENVVDGVVRKSAFEKYLNRSKEFSIKKLSDIIVLEPKIGIARSPDTRSTEIGKLYRVDMRRLENKSNEKLSIVVDFEGLNNFDSGFLKLGGEGKAVAYKNIENIDDELNIAFPEFEDDERQFKIVLTTPAIFNNGWVPEMKFAEEYYGLKLNLFAAAVGKPINVGGFDMNKRKPKPMFKAVPAGSVYYFERMEGTMETVKELFHCKSISNVYGDEGFGISFVGKINYGGGK
jgi:CRISPR-associated protein Cmr3